MVEESREVQSQEAAFEVDQSPIDINDNESLRNALAEEIEKATKYLSNWQRAQADLTNLKRRTEQEKAETAKFANSALVSALLPILDDFERALANMTPKVAGAKWVEGVDLIYRKLFTVLEGYGLAKIEAEGKDFDPNFHHAVIHEEGEDGKVMEELQKGYMFRDRLLRPAMVKVGGKKAEE